ncbi:alpha/beta fold hydrolase [Halofilum ochraceum]|uniref:alpha/beta fold hydrolase n=1 Tax=Halofilum ochraceum TaxID=1611323 RepID=UPI0008D9D4F3|nr:alpha/beta hydrolase [Halofilum ochraceum]
MNHQVTRRQQTSVGEIAWDAVGSGPDVVLVHGTPTRSLVWQGVIERLREHYRIHYLDLPGYGESQQFEGQEVRLRSFARALREFLGERGLERPHLVGHDFGAAAVMGAHLIEAVPVASITVADGVLLSPWGTPFSRHVREHESVFAAVPGYIHRATLAAHLATGVVRPLPADLERALIEPWTGPEGQAAYYRQVGQYDYEYTEWLEARYPSLEVPVTILWGEQDGWVPPSEAYRLQAMIPGAGLRLLPDAGHFSMLDCPGLFARELDQVLRGNLGESGIQGAGVHTVRV